MKLPVCLFSLHLSALAHAASPNSLFIFADELGWKDVGCARSSKPW